MADTHKLMKLGIEPAMRQLLADHCGGIDLQPRKMPIRWNGEGNGSFEFDAVSADGRIVACLSAAGNLYPGQLRKLIMDAAFMWLVPGAQRQILGVVDDHVAKKLEALSGADFHLKLESLPSICRSKCGQELKASESLRRLSCGQVEIALREAGIENRQMLFCCYHWIRSRFRRRAKSKMDLKQLRAEWLDFAKTALPRGDGHLWRNNAQGHRRRKRGHSSPRAHVAGTDG